MAGLRIREFATEWPNAAPGTFAEWFASAPEGLAKRMQSGDGNAKAEGKPFDGSGPE